MRRTWIGALGALLALSSTAVAGGGGQANLLQSAAAARAERVSRPSYKIFLDLDLPGRTDVYEGTTDVTFLLKRASEGGLFLDFNGKRPKGSPVRGLKINGKAAEVSLDHGRLALPSSHLKEGFNRVRVTYTVAYDNDGAGLHKIEDPADGKTYLYTHFEPFDANRVFPCFDQPDLKASYELEVDAREGWTVVSGGKLASQGPGNTFRFERTKRYSPYIFALCAGPFRVWNDEKARIPGRLLVTESMAKYADPENIFRVTRQGFDFFEDYFGIPYPFEKYDQIFVPQFNWGAMENVGCVIFNDRMIFRKKPTDAQLERRANTILHEMAHMWFGDIVTMKWWNDLWLNESFATYMAHLGLARATRFKSAWETFASRTKGWAYWQDQLPTTHPIETPVPDTQTTFKNFDGITYGKGASVLKQLAFLVGEDAFRKGVASYLKRHQFKNAERADFIRSIGAAAGMDLGAWTKEWLQAAGVNTITPEIEIENGRVKSFVLVQAPGNGAKILRTHRLKVHFLYEDTQGGSGGLLGGPTAIVNVNGARTSVPELVGAAAPDFVDANNDDEAFAKVFLDPVSLAYAKAHLERLPQSMQRAAVWRAVWFMVRDQVAPPTDYLDLVVAKTPVEKEPKLLDGIFENTRRVLNQYLLPGARERYRRRLFDLAWRQVGKVEPGSDLQEGWFLAGLRFIDTAEEAERLVAMLDGGAAPKGISFEQPTRWSALARVASTGHPRTDELLAAERLRDKSQKGEAAAFQVEVARPVKAVKNDAWKRFVEDKKTSLDLLREGMKGFWQANQAQDFPSYAERFYQALPEIANTRSSYYAEAFTWRLFPSLVVTPENLALADALLENPDPRLESVKRSVRESADELRRALAIRGRQ